MTDTHEDHEQEARELLASRIQEMRTYLQAAEPDEDGETWFETEDEGPLYEAGLPQLYDYGLEWTKYLTDHINETVTYKHVLSTGGPHDEFQIMFDPVDGSISDAVFVYLPWFDRVEIPLFQNGRYAWGVEIEDVDTVTNFYATFYGELVQMDAEQ